MAEGGKQIKRCWPETFSGGHGAGDAARAGGSTTAPSEPCGRVGGWSPGLRLAIAATHPVQYQIPWYRALAGREGVELVVLYALLPTPEQQGVGFGRDFAWDVPLLDGYAWEELENTARNPSLDGFFASRTPGVEAALARARPDAVIVGGWNALPLLQALRACGRLGIPCLVRAESSGLRPRGLLPRAAHRLLLSRFDACLAIGRASRQF